MGVEVEAVKPNYKNVRYTAKGNQYRKTNIGKIAGTAGATLVSSAVLFKNRSDIKEVLTANGLDKYMKAVIALVVGACALVGLGIGGLGDFIANKIKAHKANKENTGTIV